MKKGDETLIRVVSKQARQVDSNVAAVRIVLKRQKATGSSSSLLALVHLYYAMPPANVAQR